MSDASSIPDETQRLFVAIALPEELRTEYGRSLQHDIPNVRWTRRDQLHLTLHFLGDVKKDPIKKLVNELSMIRVNAFKLVFDHCGFFPVEQRPRVFWLGFKRSASLTALHSEIKHILGDLGLAKDDRAFKPHLTIARLGNGYNGKRFNQRLRAHFQPFIDRDFTVRDFHLYCSELKHGGAQHTCLYTVSCSQSHL